MKRLLEFKNQHSDAATSKWFPSFLSRKKVRYICFEFGKKAEQYITDRDSKLVFTFGLVHCFFFTSKVKKPLQKGDVLEVEVRDIRDSSSRQEEVELPQNAEDSTN